MLAFARRNPLVLIGGGIMLAVVFASVCAPLLTASDPVRPSFGQRLKAPWGLGGTSARPLGADNLGRDIYARLLYGGRISLVLATSAVLLATGVGVLVGLLAGFIGGRLDDLVMRLADVQLTREQRERAQRTARRGDRGGRDRHVRRLCAREPTVPG